MTFSIESGGMVGVTIEGMWFHAVTTTKVLKILLVGVEAAIPMLLYFNKMLIVR